MNDTPRVGRMLSWQRWTTYVVLGACLLSGLVYWIVLDLVEAAPPQTKVWWIAHGLTSLVALMAIGGALAHHVRLTWRFHRGRVSGTANLVALVVLIVTALVMFYGLAAWRDLAITIHWIVGLVSIVLFPLHVLWGRTRVARHGRNAPPP